MSRLLVSKLVVSQLRRQFSSKHLNVKSVEITTCKDTYTNRRDKYIFKNCPKQGVKIDVTYADSSSTGTSKLPVVLALHGAPGSFEDFKAIFQHFATKSESHVRVISPNFPDMAFTDATGAFRHSTDEKAEFIRDFLKQLDIEKVDVVVMHSAATYPCLKLWKQQPDLFKSLMIMNPIGHVRPKSMQPDWFFDNASRMNLCPATRSLFRNFGKPILTRVFKHMKIDNIDNFALTLTTMYLAKVERLKKYLPEISNLKPPTVFAFSEKDKLTDKKLGYAMAELMGAKSDDIQIFDKDAKIVKEAIENWIRVLVFRDDGHYAFQKHSAIINSAIEQLLSKVKK